ncbi:MAG: hypothetical protein H8E85_03490 [Candidatus Marinimicrobia bacterium]|nr:hypothetical protein [Candidatus Neomarinimicrobiota bacterium]
MKSLQLSILYLGIIYMFSCSENQEIHISKTVQFEGKIYLLDSDDPFTGILYNEYSNGQREYEGYYKKGSPNGKLTYYFENGSIMREGVLKSGSPAGRWTYYNSNGSIKEIRDH